ncbi:MAG TPA: LysM peptidoglycan-binding domain-containing protein [Actinomycetes bacterium]|nr:LysM peptidoglycan-binding domain-containing protein [Actinomycetes bacterium]
MSHTLTAPQALQARQALRPAGRALRSSQVRRSPGGTGSASVTRLTFRGRLVLVALLVMVGFGVFSVGQIASHALAVDSSSPASSVPTDSWVVQPGETLWQIAESVAPGVDPRDTVARIVELNDLPNSSVAAGQSLLVPA